MRCHEPAWMAAAAMLAACGGDAGQEQVSETAITAATLGPQSVLTNAEYLATQRYAAADPGNGRMQVQTCRACHTLEAGGVHAIGPNLHGMFGRWAGQRDGYAYSDALREAEFVWTPEALDAWLAAPGRFLPGTLMAFPGVENPGDRDDLIAYLLTVTDSGAGTR